MGTDKPFVIVQMSDPHIGASWAASDPLALLRTSVAAIRRAPFEPDLVIVSGDLADHGSRGEYALVQEELASLQLPVHVVPGNHDDRRTLRASFRLPGEADAPINYADDLGPLRLLMLDSTIPGADRGDLDHVRLAWLKAALRDAPQRPTIVVMHHPPLRTGIPALDSIGLGDSALLELGRILAHNEHVLAVLSGHLHKAIAGTIGGRAALTAPSTYVQVRLDLGATEFVPADEEPPAFAIHTLLAGRLISYVQPVIRDAASNSFDSRPSSRSRER